MPIQAPADSSTTRTPYGPVAVVSPTPDTTDDPTAVGYVAVQMSVYRSKTASTAETDLLTPTGTAITAVTPDATTGACEWQGPPGYAGVMWIADPATGRRWPVHPSDYAGPATGSSSVTWDTLTGRPFVVAAADTPQGARDAIQAVTLSQVTKTQVALGNVQNLAPADMPVSIAQAQAIQNAQDFAVQTAKNYVDTKPIQNFTNFDSAVRAIVQDELSGPAQPGNGVPSQPTITSAVASTTGDPATITVVWTPPANNGGSVITGYKVYRGDTGLVTQTPLSAGTTTLQLTNFTVGVSYDVGVSAINASGEGPISWWRNLIPTGNVAPPPSNKPGYPTNVTYTIGTDASSNPTITPAWLPPATDGGSAVTGYYVYRTVPGSADYKTGLLGPTTRSFLLTNFAYNTSYNVGVSAVNVNGEGPVFWVNNIVPTSGTVTPPPTGGGTPGSGLSTGTGIAALWYFGFQRPWLSELPADVKTTYNHYIVGIAQSAGSGTGSVQWGPGNNGQSAAAFQADVDAIHARGATISIGVGGSGDGGIACTNATQETQMYNSLKSIIDTYNLDGVDWDIETNGWTASSLFNVSKRLQDNYGLNFIIGCTSQLYSGDAAGNPQAKWLNLAQLLGTRMAYMSPMLYDFPQAATSELSAVTVSKIDIMANAGIPRSKMIMGYMLKPPGGYANASTPAIALAAIQYAVAQRPGIRGTYMWESWIEGQNNYTGARSFGSWVRSNIKV